LPALYSTQDKPLHELVAQVKFFDPCGRYTYYAIEFDPKVRCPRILFAAAAS
jgi:hypothetical protein